MTNKTAKTGYRINELIKKRWSPRAFSDQRISNEHVIKLIEAAKWAPSSFNEQPWRFIVGIKGEGEAYQHVLDTLVPFNQEWAQHAPVLLIACAKKTFSQNDKPNRHAYYDVGQAMATLSLQAMDDGLFVHQMAGFDPEKARETFLIPDSYDAVTAVAIGYLGDPETLNEKNRAAEEADRTRKPLDDICFGDEWGQKLL